MPRPGEFRGGRYYRRIKPGSRHGPIERHDRRLNPVRQHFYGRDIREFSKIPVQAHRRKGVFVRRTLRRR